MPAIFGDTKLPFLAWIRNYAGVATQGDDQILKDCSDGSNELMPFCQLHNKEHIDGDQSAAGPDLDCGEVHGCEDIPMCLEEAQRTQYTGSCSQTFPS